MTEHSPLTAEEQAALKYRELRKEELGAFPFWKQLCFAYAGWNISFNPQSPEEWLEQFSTFGVGQSDLDFIMKAAHLHEAACERLAQELARLTLERDDLEQRCDPAGDLCARRHAEDSAVALLQRAEQAEARAARLQAMIRRACKLFEQHRAAHADPTDADYNGCETEPCACCEESLAIAVALAEEDKP